MSWAPLTVASVEITSTAECSVWLPWAKTVKHTLCHTTAAIDAATIGPVYLPFQARLNHTTNPISQAIFKGRNMQYNWGAVHKHTNSADAKVAHEFQ